jgi:hypothetical protein
MHEPTHERVSETDDPTRCWTEYAPVHAVVPDCEMHWDSVLSTATQTSPPLQPVVGAVPIEGHT